MKKVIVTGGRDYNDFVMVTDILDFIKPDLVIQGGATGADSQARNYCAEWHIECLTYEADWNKFGRVAGPIRNKQMCSEHQDAIVIAFPGGKGTENCIKEAVKLNMIVMRVEK